MPRAKFGLRRDLKVAILDSGLTQRQVSIATQIPETRLSAIVCLRADPTSEEKRALADLLRRPVESLFTAAREVA